MVPVQKAANSSLKFYNFPLKINMCTVLFYCLIQVLQMASVVISLLFVLLILYIKKKNLTRLPDRVLLQWDAVTW